MPHFLSFRAIYLYVVIHDNKEFAMRTNEEQSNPSRLGDRHRADSIQLTTWISRSKHAAFFEACQQRGTTPSFEIRTFVDTRIANIEGAVYEQQ